MSGSGNMLVDLHEQDENRRSKSLECCRCDGSGRVGWDTINDGYEKFADELSHIIYRRMKENNPVTSFREMLRVARIIRKEGADCPSCDGSGEIYE